MCLLFKTTIYAQWALTGNATIATNFLGTTNSQPLNIKVNNQEAGLIDFTNDNTFFGYLSGSANTGSWNTAYGYKSLTTNTSGHSDAAYGFEALFSNTTGTWNTGLGNQALYSNTTGNYNSGIGSGALYTNTSGNGDVANGLNSLYYNTTGSWNTAVGIYALENNTTGFENVAIGDSASFNNTTGYDITAVGAFAGPNSISTNLTNSSAFGAGATLTASNQVVIGNSSVTSIGGYANWTNFSDGRFKNNIQENVPGLSFIKLLRPITYNLDIKGINNFLHRGKELISTTTAESAILQKGKIVYTGFVAQEVEVSAKKLDYDFSGVVSPQNDNGLYGLRYSDFVVPMVKAIQELSNANDSLKSVIEGLKTTETNLQSQVNIIMQQLNSLKATTFSGQKPALQQNAPNPFNSATTINYYLPSNSTKAQLTITDGQGRLLKDVVLNSSKGPGQAIINARELASGTYFYSLVINGKNIDTKRMVLTK